MDTVIATKGLTRSFGDNLAVDHLDLTVERGEVFGFLGPNGAGKTTTVRLLNALLKPSEGSAQVLGLDITTQGEEIRRQTGVLTETPSVYEALTARENLLFFGDLYGVPEDELPGRVNDLLEELGLGDRADDRVGTYSKGMRQRLVISRALLHRPALVFLDEPTAGLDPAAARMVNEMIQNLSHTEGRTVFLCTHNLAEAQRLCDRVAVIDRGALRAVGTPEQLARELWLGSSVEIDLRGEPPAEVLQALDRLPVASLREVRNGRLVVELDDEKNIPDVVTAIVIAGGRIHAVMPQQHTLEDIYFRIQGEEPVDEMRGDA
ncbi:MAG TPA: ABC transporter ATP-binding protein [Chloroflexi bacterium]|jgi:ABC-2 type transport system ATP-binding protein|nr:ABC transporter ATP-binding protein [Chloroflexota bacterium]